MSENPRKRRHLLEKEGTTSAVDENEGIVDDRNEQDNHLEETHNSSSIMMNSKEDLICDDDNDDNIIDGNDDNSTDDSSDDNPGGNSDDDDDVANNDNNDDKNSSQNGDCHLQRTIMDKDASIDGILELIDLYPMEVQHMNKVTGNYPLHTACSCEDDVDDIAMKLLKMFPEAAQHKNVEGLYPLHLAARDQQSDDLLMKLIEVCPEAVSQSTRFGTALLLTCQSLIISETVAAKLIEIYPQALQETDRSGDYPIHCAFTYSLETAFIKVLLDSDPLALQRRTEDSFSDGKTPFHIACEKSNDELVEYLLQRLDLIMNIRDQNGRTPLHYACCMSWGDKVVEMLLHHPDVDVNATDTWLDTPLHDVIKFFGRHPERSVNKVQNLLNHPCILMNENYNKKNSPLDLIKSRINVLEKNRNDNADDADDANEDNNDVEEKLQCAIRIRNLLVEYPIKKRWQAYCYHVKNFIDVDFRFVKAK